VSWSTTKEKLTPLLLFIYYFFYIPQAILTIYQKGAYYSGIQFFNNLPLEIKNVAGKKEI